MTAADGRTDLGYGPGEPAAGPSPLASSVVSALRRAGLTCAVAESLTGGLVLDALVAVPGASACLRGGVVAYQSDVKRDLLDVSADLLAREGAVHPEVAAQMATGVRRRLAADVGVATTGVAGPDPQDGRPPGTVHVAVAGPDGVRVVSWGPGTPAGPAAPSSERPAGSERSADSAGPVSGGRAAVRRAARDRALRLVLEVLGVAGAPDAQAEPVTGPGPGPAPRPAAT